MEEAEHHVLVHMACDENLRLKQDSVDEIDWTFSRVFAIFILVRSTSW